jgi:hypothetical protein
MSRLEFERLHHNLKRLDLITFESIMDNHLEIAPKDAVLDNLFYIYMTLPIFPGIFSKLLYA